MNFVGRCHFSKLLPWVLLFLWMSSISLYSYAKEESTPAKKQPSKRKKKKPQASRFKKKKKNCRSLVEPQGFGEKLARLWDRRRRNPIMAYRMMILSTISYWEFHRRPTNRNTTGFSLTLDYARQGGGKHGTGGPWSQFVSWSRSTLMGASLAVSLLDDDRYRSRQKILYMPSEHSTVAAAPNNSSTFHQRDNKQTQVQRTKSRHGHPKHRATFQYEFFNWREKGVAGLNFHDTDVLLSTMEDGSLVVSFAGTSSPADAITSIQTFESANHSGFYHGGGHSRKKKKKHRKYPDTIIQGSVHRGFLNALVRVDRGSVLRLCPGSHPDCQRYEQDYLQSLHTQFRHCTSTDTVSSHKVEPDTELDDWIQPVSFAAAPASNYTHSKKNNDSMSISSIRPRRRGGCQIKGQSLLTILQQVVSAALEQGRIVHLTGHSLGGGLASHMALDLIVNHPELSVRNLHLWTFGAPQIADATFLASAIELAPRLQPFVTGQNGRYHRYVTVSDDCRADVISEVTKLSLPSHFPKGFHGKMARTLGGVHSPVVHFTAEPHILLTPHQFMQTYTNATTTASKSGGDDAMASLPNSSSTTFITKTHSTVAAHATVNYLHGISRESRYHPLQTDLPEDVRTWLGEYQA